MLAEQGYSVVLELTTISLAVLKSNCLMLNDDSLRTELLLADTDFSGKNQSIDLSFISSTKRKKADIFLNVNK